MMGHTDFLFDKRGVDSMVLDKEDAAELRECAPNASPASNEAGPLEDPFADVTEEELDSFYRFLERNALEESPFVEGD